MNKYLCKGRCVYACQIMEDCVAYSGQRSGEGFLCSMASRSSFKMSLTMNGESTYLALKKSGDYNKLSLLIR